MRTRRRYADYPPFPVDTVPALDPTHSPTSKNLHMCSVCVRALNPDDDNNCKTGEIALSFNGKPLAVQRRICGRCIETLRERLRSAISELQP